MVNSFEEWIGKLTEAGLLCGDYVDKVDNAMSNKQIVDIGMDANGISYLPEMSSKGMPLPYDIITSRFSNFINGRYVCHTKSRNGNEYTSALYCKYAGDIDDADTTLLTLLGCSCTVNIAENAFVRIYVDSNSAVQVNCPESAMAIIEYWGDAEVSASGKVKKIKHGR